MTTRRPPTSAWLRDRLAGIAALGGLLAVAASLAGLAGGTWWAFDLASHFRVQYLLCLAAAAAVLAGLGRRRTAVLFAVVAIGNAALVLPLYLGGGAAARGAGPGTLRVLLANVHTSNDRYELVRALIRESAPDIVVLQEVDRGWLEALADLDDILPHVTTEPRADNFGIAVLSRHAPRRTHVTWLGDATLPSIMARFGDERETLTLIATHPFPPNGAEGSARRNRQLEHVAELARESPTPVIVVGDLNATPWSHHFRKLLRDSGLRNASRGFGVRATWPAGLLPLRIPIDHCLCSSEVAVVATSVGPDIGSDHFPLIVDLRVPGHPQAARAASRSVTSTAHDSSTSSAHVGGQGAGQSPHAPRI
jgi:endonuclease/exonuclease/phosphatase (EEP) superfamily protein YafD